jgi:hypothetical protein
MIITFQLSICMMSRSAAININAIGKSFSILKCDCSMMIVLEDVLFA